MKCGVVLCFQEKYRTEIFEFLKTPPSYQCLPLINVSCPKIFKLMPDAFSLVFTVSKYNKAWRANNGMKYGNLMPAKKSTMAALQSSSNDY